MNDAMRPDHVEPPHAEPDDENQIEIRQPTKLIRIASMTRAMLEEVRQAPLDEAGRNQLRAIHQATLAELREVLTDELLEEFNEIILPIAGEAVPSESVLRIAQAQLIGWLEGLFHGIQASLFSQQVAAQTQLAEMQRRALNRPEPGKDEQSGLYL